MSVGTTRAAAEPSDVRPRLVSEEAGCLLRLAAPIMLIALVNRGMAITDTAMVSAFFGAEALAAVAIGSDLQSIVFYLGAGVIGALAPFYTAAMVQQDPIARWRLERVGQITVVLLALTLAPLVWFAPDWLRLFGLEPALLQQGRGYTQAMAVTLLPMLGVMLYRTILTAAERPRVFLYVTVAMLPLNGAANWVFMLGMGPIPAFGPTGAGIASLVVAVTSLAVLAWVARGGSQHTTRPSSLPRLDWGGVAAVMRVGIPIGIATVADVGIFLGATIYAATLGAADVAAHTLTLRIAGVAYTVSAALLQASMVRMARAEALGDPVQERAVVRSSLVLSLALGVLLCGLLTAGAAPLSQLVFHGDAAGLAAAGIATALLAILGVKELLVGPGSAASGLLRGRKDTQAPMLYVLIGHWALGAPLGVYLCEGRAMGITGVWIGLGIGSLLTTALMLWRLSAGNDLPRLVRSAGSGQVGRPGRT